MRNLHVLDCYRQVDRKTIELFGTVGNASCGAFLVPSKIDDQPLVVIASSGFDWDHVSVSRKNRCPNWPEMCHIKSLFFKDDEVVMQLHVAAKDHISYHENCLHLWRPHTVQIPLPPGWMVGPREGQTREECIKEANDDIDKMEGTQWYDVEGQSGT